MYHTTIETLWQSRDMLSALERISDSESRSICMIPFGSVTNIFHRFSQKSFPNKKLKVVKAKKTSVLYELEVYAKTSGNLQASGKFIVYKLPGYEYVYLLITLDNTDFFHSYVRSFIVLQRTDVILSFIKSNELIGLIENYQSAHGIDDIIITRASQRIRYHEERRMTTVTWNNSSLEDANSWLHENDGFFKSIQFKAIRLDQEITNSYIDRRGTMRIDRHFSKLYQSLTVPAIQLLENYIILFNKRGRRDNKLLEVKPLEINFGKELFKEKANHKNFIEKLSWLPDTSISVMHGNPYIHLSLLDYLDGSAYELWVLDTQQLLIVPQLHSTIVSLQRMVNHIFDYYAEGDIKDHENK